MFCFELRARAARTCCHCHLAVKNSIHDGKRGQLKLPKSHERYHNVVMWHWLVYKWRRSKQMFSFHRTFFNLLDFTVSLSCRDCHSETPWSHSSNQPGGTYCQTRDFLLRTNYTLEMWCANAKLANQVPTSPVKYFGEVWVIFQSTKTKIVILLLITRELYSCIGIIVIYDPWWLGNLVFLWREQAALSHVPLVPHIYVYQLSHGRLR